MKHGFVKVGAYTPEIKVADTLFNAESIKKGIDIADSSKVEVLVFPELSITGATCGDLFYQDTLLKGAITALKDIADYTVDKELIAFVGLPIKKDGVIYNVSAGISKGMVLGFVPKTHLKKGQTQFSTYNGDLTYYDLDGDPVPMCERLLFNGETVKIAVEIGEDLYAPVSPAVYGVNNGANLIVHMSSEPMLIGLKEFKSQTLKAESAKLITGFVSANAGFGESTTDYAYGGYNVICENGSLIKESNLFENGLTVSEIDLSFIENERAKSFTKIKDEKEVFCVGFSVDRKDAGLTREFNKTPFVPTGEDLISRAELILDIQAEGLKKRIVHTNAKNLVLGLSGGLDSTLAILVCITALKKLNRSLKDIIAITMPCFGTTSRTYLNTIKLAKAAGATLKKVDITKAVVRHLKDIKHQDGVFDAAYENAQARERTQVLMDVANMCGGMVIGTGDLSELALGWATYNGDHMSMYGVNASIPKTLVRHVVECYSKKSKGKLKAVLDDILDTPVSPELLPPKDGDIAQKTEDIVGPYLLHDFFLYNIIRKGYTPSKVFFVAEHVFKDQFDRETILKWLKTFIRRFFSQQFKRSCVPDGVCVGTVGLSPRGAFSMPSDAVVSLWLNELEEL